ncbi:sucrase ferredoxin [Nocardia sp. BMG111209]|uniref:sucrase ferredoxin n=1 Tax=Nocardia sp. BMG111209 TaxID=1160137 RepID=UPI0003673519|nr:sucrase ferredoxin [Nocardia sp. BMG111209]
MTTATDYRCAAWTRDQGVDPIGTAPTCDTLVLIEVPPPWPRDVNTLPVFADILARGLPRTRLLAVRPIAAQPSTKSTVPVTIWRRTDRGRFAGTDYDLPAEHLADAVRVSLTTAAALDPAAVDSVRAGGNAAAAIDSAAAIDLGNDHSVAPRPSGPARRVGAPDDALAPPPSDERFAGMNGRPAPAEVLLCGHGIRDKCCGRLGARLALDVGAGVPGVRVRHCSHTGGHRFAPTGFTMPDGLVWSFLDADLLDGIVRHAGAPPLRDGHYRGNTALDRWGQVVERALFERYGWSWLDRRITLAHTEIGPGGRTAAVELAWSGGSGPGRARAEVEVVRDIPVLVCGEHPDAARKVAPELQLRSLHLGD